MSSPIVPITYYVAERTRSVFTSVIQDEDGVGIPGASLLTLTLTLYEQASGAIINSRSAQSVLNANGGTVDPSGNFSMVFSPADNAHVGLFPVEKHVALFRWTYDTDGAGQHEAIIQIVDQPKVSA